MMEGLIIIRTSWTVKCSRRCLFQALAVETVSQALMAILQLFRIFPSTVKRYLIKPPCNPIQRLCNQEEGARQRIVTASIPMILTLTRTSAIAQSHSQIRSHPCTIFLLTRNWMRLRGTPRTKEKFPYV